MEIRNYLKAELHTDMNCHGGKGETRHAVLYDGEVLQSALSFLIYTELAPGASIGYHKHGQDEEVYIILEGKGIMEVDDVEREVKAGDAVLNRPGGSHGLRNHTDRDLKILVFEAKQA